MTVKERIEIYADSKGLSVKQVCDRCGLSNGYFNNTAQPSRRAQKLIHKACPELNMAWLMLGEGDMLGTVKEVTVDEQDTAASADVKDLASRLKIARDAVDKVYGDGYAAGNPQLVSAVLNAAAAFDMAEAVESLRLAIGQNDLIINSNE